MRIIHDESDYSGRGTAVALGTFDGVHIGHQRLIETAVRLAGERGLDAAVCTFDRHPFAVLCPEKAPLALLAPEEKLEKLERLGVQIALVRPFTREFAARPPRAFLEDLVRGLRARAVIVGGNYTFGRGGAGNSELIRALAPELGYEPVVVDAVMDGGEMVSSTLIRRLLEAGDTQRARRLMGQGV